MHHDEEITSDELDTALDEAETLSVRTRQETR